MIKKKDFRQPRLSRSERRRLEEEERLKLQRWVEDKQHNEIFQQTLREFSRRRGTTIEYDPNDKDSVWKVLQAQPAFSKIAHRMMFIAGATLVLILMILFYLSIKEPGQRKFPAKPATIYVSPIPYHL